MLEVAADIIEDQGLRANGLVSEITLDPVVRNDVVDFPSGESMTKKHHTLLHTHRVSLYANVGLLMILVDVPMQTSICVMDEVAKLFEHVEIDIRKASTGIPSVTPPATVPGPVRNIRQVWTGQGGTSVVPGMRQRKKLRSIVIA